MVPIRTSILLRSGVEMRGLMGAEFMYHSLLKLGRSRRTRSHSSANRVHRDWSWRDEAWSRREGESRDSGWDRRASSHPRRAPRNRSQPCRSCTGRHHEWSCTFPTRPHDRHAATCSCRCPRAAHRCRFDPRGAYHDLRHRWTSHKAKAKFAGWCDDAGFQPNISLVWIEKNVPYTPGPMVSYLEGWCKVGLQ